MSALNSAPATPPFSTVDPQISAKATFSHIHALVFPIPSNILQAISPAVVPAITQVINASFNSGTFPSLFKVARVTPLLKKPSLDPTQVENYRPVSLLTLLSKTIERAASKQVT